MLFDFVWSDAVSAPGELTAKARRRKGLLEKLHAIFSKNLALLKKDAKIS
jgi:hypothetical protein